MGLNLVMMADMPGLECSSEGVSACRRVGVSVWAVSSVVGVSAQGGSDSGG